MGESTIEVGILWKKDADEKMRDEDVDTRIKTCRLAKEDGSRCPGVNRQRLIKA